MDRWPDCTCQWYAWLTLCLAPAPSKKLEYKVLFCFGLLTAVQAALLVSGAHFCMAPRSLLLPDFLVSSLILIIALGALRSAPIPEKAPPLVPNLTLTAVVGFHSLLSHPLLEKHRLHHSGPLAAAWARLQHFCVFLEAEVGGLGWLDVG